MNTHQYLKIFLCLTLLSMLFFGIQAQSLDNISVEKGLSVSGDINWSNVIYATSGEQRRDPFNSILSGNLNLNLFGYDMPFSFSWSNSRRSYTQPFNRLSFTPSYKWVRAYLGYTGMTFSPYTLAGHSFLGAGAELSPGNWRFAVMAGRLNKAIEHDPLNYPDIEPAYRRMGYAVKAGYEQGSHAVSVSVFTASDDKNSIRSIPAGPILQPQSNVATSISGRTQLFSALTLDAEYSLSVLNRDTRIQTAVSDSAGHSLSSPSLLDETAATRIFGAINTGIGYNAAGWGIQFRYERVAPDYQTLGAYYFNNDMENYTVVPSLRLLEGRLTIAGNAGIQRNNLNNEREATTRRFAGSGTVSYTSGERLNLSASYSNFSTYTRNRPQTDPFATNPMDSLDFYQVSGSLNGMAGYSFGDNEKVRSLMLNMDYRKINNTGNREGGGELSDFISANAGYTHGFPSELTLTASINANINNASQMQSVYWGPSLTAAKMFLEKTLRTGINCAYNQSRMDGKTDAPVVSTGLNATWSPKSQNEKAGKHNINLNMSWIQRFKSDTRPGQNELTASLGYGYSF